MLALPYQILSSWLNSLKIFTPKQGKLFFLVTLKTIIHAYWDIFKKFWWFVAFCCLVDIVFVAYGYALSSTSKLAFIAVIWVAWNTFFFLSLLTIRPSIARKDYNYYLSYWHHFLLFLILMIIMDGIIFLAIVKQAVTLPILLLVIFIVPFMPSLLAAGYFVVTIFFSLNSQLTLKEQLDSLYRALKMMMFNYPFFLILGLLSLSIFFGVQKLVQSCLALFVSDSGYNTSIMQIIARDTAQFLVPIFMCIANNFYIKEIHEQFKRYHPR